METGIAATAGTSSQCFNSFKLNKCRIFLAELTVERFNKLMEIISHRKNSNCYY